MLGGVEPLVVVDHGPAHAVLLSSAPAAAAILPSNGEGVARDFPLVRTLRLRKHPLTNRIGVGGGALEASADTGGDDPFGDRDRHLGSQPEIFETVIRFVRSKRSARADGQNAGS
jgi:hypothetical protein